MGTFELIGFWAMSIPSLFIAGNSKSGTTALHSFLSAHPSIFMSVPKEPNYFAKDFCRDTDPSRCFYRRTEVEYTALFDAARPDQICGEASACYLYSQVAAQEIAKFNPEAKIIFVLREPVDFLRSYHLQLLKNSPQDGENVKDFERALELEKERKIGKNIPPKCLIPEFLYYSDRVKYAEQLKRFYDCFDASQIKVFIYDDWVQDNHSVYREILEWLGIDATFQPNFNIHNKGGVRLRSKLMQNLVQDISHGNGVLAPIKNLSKKTISQESCRQILDWMYTNLVFSKAEILDAELRQKLQKAFRPEVEALSRLLNRDLITLWNYR